MPRVGKANARNIAEYAREQIRQARSEAASSGHRAQESSLGAVKKVRVSKHDPTMKVILDIINK